MRFANIVVATALAIASADKENDSQTVSTRLRVASNKLHEARPRLSHSLPGGPAKYGSGIRRAHDDIQKHRHRQLQASSAPGKLTLVGTFDEGPGSQSCRHKKSLSLPEPIYTDTVQIKVNSFVGWPSLRIGVNGESEDLLITATSFAEGGNCDPQNAALPASHGCSSTCCSSVGWCGASASQGDVLTIKLRDGPTEITSLDLEGIYGGEKWGHIEQFDLFYESVHEDRSQFVSSPDMVGWTLQSWYLDHNNGGSGRWPDCEQDMCRADPKCNSWMGRNSGNTCYLSEATELRQMNSDGTIYGDHHPHTFYKPESCLHSCGFQSRDRVCWCDDQCTGYNDCCEDYSDVCSAPSPNPTPVSYTTYSVPNFRTAQELVLKYAAFMYEEQAKELGIAAWELWLERNPNSPLENAIEAWRKNVNSELNRAFPRNPKQIGEYGLLYGPEGPAQGLSSPGPTYMLSMINEEHWFTFKAGTGRERPATATDLTIDRKHAVIDFSDWYIPIGTYDNSRHFILGCRGRGCAYDAHRADEKRAWQNAISQVYQDIDGHPLFQLWNGIQSLCGVGCGVADAMKKEETWIGKDGALTKAVEQIVPGGGVVTAIFHSAAGNEKHAQAAAIKGATSGATAIAIVVTGGAAAAAGGATAMALGSAATVTIAGAGSMAQTASLAALTGAPVKESIFYDGLSGSLQELPGTPGAVIGTVAAPVLEAGGLTSDDDALKAFLKCGGDWDYDNQVCK